MKRITTPASKRQPGRQRRTALACLLAAFSIGASAGEQRTETAAGAAAAAPLAAALGAALSHWEAAADRGDWRAQETAGLLALGAALERGDPAHAQTTRALGWLTRAAEQGSEAARRALAELYAQGRLVPRDERLAHWWRTAGTQDDAGCR